MRRDRGPRVLTEKKGDEKKGDVLKILKFFQAGKRKSLSLAKLAPFWAEQQTVAEGGSFQADDRPV